MRRGFTLIELLVVIAIIAILVSLVIAGATALGIGSKKSQTGAIISALRKGLELAAAQSGSGFSPAEHPLAGSRAERFAFRGRRGRAADGSGGSWTALDAAGEALKGPAEWLIDSSSASRLLDPEDVYADARVPMLYGWQRHRLGVVGGDLSATTWYRMLPTKPRPGLATIPGPFTATELPDASNLHRPLGTGADVRRTLDVILGSSNVLAELASLKAVVSPPNDNAAERILAPSPGAFAGADNGGRVWSPEPLGGEGKWKPGRVLDGPGKWKLYQLRGISVVDVWRRELLIWGTANGTFTIASAGRDGVFALDPGDVGLFNTTAENANVPQGSDKDGSRDNIIQGALE
jgi:prepilin-type N-terminal cleavage/methylation domain-containing protein